MTKQKIRPCKTDCSGNKVFKGIIKKQRIDPKLGKGRFIKKNKQTWSIMQVIDESNTF